MGDNTRNRHAQYNELIWKASHFPTFPIKLIYGLIPPSPDRWLNCAPLVMKEYSAN